MGRLLVFGTSHNVAPARLRDGLYMDEETVRGFLDDLVGCRDIREAALLHTCTRLEVYALTSESEAAEQAIVDRLADGDEGRRDDIHRHSYALTDEAAVRHLLRVAAGLDSIVLGETQILGQVRDAARIATELGSSGPILTRLFAAGVRAGKRARAETDLGRGPTSLAAAGVRLALEASDDFPSQTVLVIGAGDTARLVARHVAKCRPGRLVVANRTAEHAKTLADEIGAEAVPITSVRRVATEATIIVAATSAPEPLLGSRDLAKVMEARPDTPLVVIDLGRPRNVERPVEPIANLVVHDLDGLADAVGRSRERQVREIPRVEAIVEEECERFAAWRRGRAVLPHVRALRRHFFETGRRELEGQEANFSSEQREALEAYTRTLITKLLHGPTVRIKQADCTTLEGLATLEAVESLFDLDV